MQSNWIILALSLCLFVLFLEIQFTAKISPNLTLQTRSLSIHQLAILVQLSLMDKPEQPRKPQHSRRNSATSFPDPLPQLSELRQVDDQFKALLRKKFSDPEDLEYLGLHP
jgi:hypothetical protein